MPTRLRGGFNGVWGSRPGTALGRDVMVISPPVTLAPESVAPLSARGHDDAGPSPDGSPWPSVSIVVLSATGRVGFRTRQSITAQSGVSVEVMGVATGSSRSRAIADALGRVRHPCAMILDDGDHLAPDALPTALMTAFVARSAVVAGLRVGPDRSVDVIGLRPGPLDANPLLAEAETSDATLSTGADLLFRRDLLDGDALARIGASRDPVTTLLRALAGEGAELAVMGQVIVHVGRAIHPVATAEPMQVMALNDSGLSGGGAAIAHRRLVQSLRFAGHAVDVEALFDRARKAAAERTRRFPAFEERLAAKPYDLVLAGNIHGVTRGIDVLREANHRAPVAAVTHDLFLLTGRCDIPIDCPVLETGCDRSCPTPDAYPELRPGRIASALAEKRAFLGGDPAPLLLSNSDWMTAEGRRLLGAGLADRVAQIDLPFPTQVFRPRDRAGLRRSLGLPQTDVLILLAAVVADAPRKGLSDVLTVLRGLARPGVGFVAIGRLDRPDRLGLPNLIATGPIGSEDEMARWIGACDLHVTASRSETLGQTAIEAGLCGVPTVAFRRTGLTTAVIDGVSGMLVDDTEPGGFEAAIEALVVDSARRRALGAWGSLALASRNSFAAGALSLHHALVAHGRSGLQTTDRIAFSPDILGVLRGAERPQPGVAGAVPPRPGRLTRLARNGKRRVFGQETPTWLRWSVDATQRLGGAARRCVGTVKRMGRA